ncbi:MAG: transposase, partial [Chloroflexota bacterium]|nr:transposase [Chloroflexota bacterium]
GQATSWAWRMQRLYGPLALSHDDAWPKNRRRDVAARCGVKQHHGRGACNVSTDRWRYSMMTRGRKIVAETLQQDVGSSNIMGVAHATSLRTVGRYSMMTRGACNVSTDRWALFRNRSRPNNIMGVAQRPYRGKHMTKFRNKYRVESTRLPGWDYASPAWYFVTICTRRRIEFFGQVTDGQLRLSDLGQIAHRFWQNIPRHHLHVAVDESVIMPNHAHGIIVITWPGTNDTIPPGETPPDDAGPDGKTLSNGGGAVEMLYNDGEPGNAETLLATSLRDNTNRFSTISPKAGSLSVVIRSYKTAVTKWARRNGRPDFAWQPRFHDHIIRNQRSLDLIRQYIRDNPQRWVSDRHNLVIE